ncbi:hypothetical protein PAF17_19020 [Paracoccus sp. Z330]|uniref:Uncharacterized protein n=1 Tax=Paracoccus onchidii TaxID=3017813 RepID=A0ABT4ZKE8_9RHOB|nr:hypothetical protein [Paracoccus onchidii]MDB6179567.1 hypothetical protein [Paracoccus onchidii]
MHSDIYRKALKNDLIDTIRDSEDHPFQTFRGMAVIVDDLLPVDATDAQNPIYKTVLFAPGVVEGG